MAIRRTSSKFTNPESFASLLPSSLRESTETLICSCKNLQVNSTSQHNERIAKMTFDSVYPLYVTKVEKKGRTKAELHQVIEWLTGYDETTLQKLIDDKITFEQFFKGARLNSNAHLITGVICGYRIEEITEPLTKQVRYLDKLVDELAKGRKMEKILRIA